MYVLSSLPTCSKIIGEVNKIIIDFLWDGKGDKIKRTVLMNNYEDGSLKMLDITTFSKSLKATWLQKYFDDSNKGKWKHFFAIKLRKSWRKVYFYWFP